ncbi:hypothetical protein HAX54_021824, partial [Datura stramonium]|nr:hypothetical protein [Datura stramonium]
MKALLGAYDVWKIVESLPLPQRRKTKRHSHSSIKFWMKRCSRRLQIQLTPSKHGKFFKLPLRIWTRRKRRKVKGVTHNKEVVSMKEVVVEEEEMLVNLRPKKIEVKAPTKEEATKEVEDGGQIKE